MAIRFPLAVRCRSRLVPTWEKGATDGTLPKTITTTITTPDDKEFTDLTLTDEASPRGPPVKITSTYHHPYWSETRNQWTDAGDLTPGEQLRQPNGKTLTVQANRNYPYAVTTHNLTVDDFHTYYVLAGATPVLVHNCEGSKLKEGEQYVYRAVKDDELKQLLDTRRFQIPGVSNRSTSLRHQRVRLFMPGPPMRSSLTKVLTPSCAA